MGTIIGLLVDKGLSERAARALAYAGLLLTLAGMIGGVVAWIRHDAVADHEVRVERRAAPATEKAASERVADAVHNAKQAQERHDVIAAEPDQPIAPTSRALGCKRLRDAGVRSPAC